MKPTDVTEDDSAVGVMCTDVFGPGWGSLRIAHLATADRVGIEIFEFRKTTRLTIISTTNAMGPSTFAFRIRT